MAKYARDLDENLVKKVQKIAREAGLLEYVNIEALRLRKARNTVGEVLVGNELAKVLTGEENFIAIALYEDAFLAVDEQTQDFWIENLIAQISYDYEKEKVIITKPELQVGIGMYHKYGNQAVEKAELALYTIKSLEEKAKALKAEQSGKKSKKKNE